MFPRHPFRSLDSLALRVLLFTSSILLTPSLEAVNGITLTWADNPEADIAGYRIHYGTESGNHPQTLDMGNEDSATVTDISEGITYYFTLTAYNTVGLESPKSPEIAVILESGTVSMVDPLIVLEPETGNLTGAMAAGFELDQNFQPTIGFIEALPSPMEGSADLVFSVPAPASYTGWARIKAPNADSDSVYLGFNEPPVEEFELVAPGDLHSTYWTWKRLETSPGNPRYFNLDAGTQELRLGKSEVGLIIDRIVLTTNSSFVPDDSMFTEQDVVVISQQPENAATIAGTELALEVSVIATETPSYQWFKDGDPIPGENSPSLNLVGFTANDAGAYCVEIQTGATSLMSETVLVTVALAPLRIESLQVSSPLGSVTLQVTGGDGTSVKLEGSSNMTVWDNLGTHPLSPTITVVDPQVPSAPRRFYRVKPGTP